MAYRKPSRFKFLNQFIYSVSHRHLPESLLFIGGSCLFVNRLIYNLFQVILVPGDDFFVITVHLKRLSCKKLHRRYHSGVLWNISKVLFLNISLIFCYSSKPLAVGHFRFPMVFDYMSLDWFDTENDHLQLDLYRRPIHL